MVKHSHSSSVQFRPCDVRVQKHERVRGETDVESEKTLIAIAGKFSRDTKMDVMRVFISTRQNLKWKSGTTLISAEARRGTWKRRKIKI